MRPLLRLLLGIDPMESIQRLASQALFAMQSIGDFAEPTLSDQDIFSVVASGDVEVLSNALDESQFDLQTVDNATGKTILHLAVSLGHEEITSMLLERAENALGLLEAKDWHGYTPLMHAIATQNIVLMHVLAKAHADTGRLAPNLDQADFERAKARTLIEAYRDLCTAFEFAAQNWENNGLKLRFEAGEDTPPTMENGITAMRTMIEHECIRADDVLDPLKNALKTGDKAAIAGLTKPGVVRLTLAAMRNRPDTEKIAALKTFINAGSDTKHWISGVVNEFLLNTDVSCIPAEERQKNASTVRDNLDDIRLMIAVGAPTIAALTRLGKSNNGMMAQQLIALGADAIGAMRLLRAATHPAAHVIAAAALNNLLETSDVADTEKVSALRTLIAAGAYKATSDLIRKMVSAGESLDTVRLLIRAGASATAALLDLSRSTDNKRAAQRRAYQLIHMGADFSPPIDWLLRVIDSATEGGKQASASGNQTLAISKQALARRTQDALNIISYAALKNVLQKRDLSNLEKIAQLQGLINKNGEEAATELVIEAVNAGHFATVKLMIAANGPTTKALIKLGSGVGVETARKLISLGTDFLFLREELLKNAREYTANGEHDAAGRERDVANLWMVAAVAATFEPARPKSNEPRIARTTGSSD
ncbi:hypothetical protein GCM10027287_13170 [Bordetella muralis]